MNTINCSHLHKRYTVGPDTITALDDVNLTVAAGEFVCIFGPSGSGKTTLLNAIAGLELPDAGTVLVNGTPITGLSESERSARRLADIGVVFQDGNLIHEFTALENVSLPLLAQGRSLREAQPASLQALARVNMAALARRRPLDMSGGQRQRVGVARGLVGERSILVADEPTGSLDSRTATDLFILLRCLANQGNTVVCATHDPSAARYATSTHHMSDGRLL